MSWSWNLADGTKTAMTVQVETASSQRRDFRTKSNFHAFCIRKGRRHPLPPGGSPAKPRRAHREEFYQRLQSLSFGERMNGCDGYFNRLNKKPRTIRPKVRKPRRYPVWLIPHMFGNREQPLRGFQKINSQGVFMPGGTVTPVGPEEWEVFCSRFPVDPEF